ncbi:hypothetical protein H257_01962 [Aphanomyces astaci]|uniref:Uncharacterized protein n=1 Tax=Aphanomyces astaci TaxID=112090 RepID=W4H747_APHAT|nr:hypothetical protein H257_01962 [Aphanomyces astaci]ETV86938.1 hypothetical protein H257_01962 [Aphanomyces astaci]|eukprot:XP_009823737.1 hypothetical protein H257_01962 [Aphanomyces astaci]
MTARLLREGEGHTDAQSFDFSRGFIRELRIHIPWTQILSQPIEIKLYTVELILRLKHIALSVGLTFTDT